MFARSEARKRRHTHAVTTVQAAVRMWRTRKQYLHTRKAIITIQSGYRGQRDRLYTKNIRFTSLIFATLNLDCFRLFPCKALSNKRVSIAT